MPPYQATAPFDWAAIHRLLVAEFAYMEGRIDPPSSLRDLTAAGIATQAQAGEVWVIGHTPDLVACMFLTPKPGTLYLGKLAVRGDQRGLGHARALVACALDRARALGLGRVELQTRMELLENHSAFAALGFHEVGRTAHPGFDRPTSITFSLPV
jgi:N-acetylglutamate synthase-like GNAT family acetyltransferase